MIQQLYTGIPEQSSSKYIVAELCYDLVVWYDGQGTCVNHGKQLWYKHSFNMSATGYSVEY